MRWDNLTAPPVEGDPERAAPATPPLPLALPGAVARTFDTPEFAGMTFYEVQAKSILNRVPGAVPRCPFEWTINPYRGCSPRLRLLLRAQDAHLSRPRRRARLRPQGRRQGQRRRAAAPGAGRAALAGRAHRDGHQRGLLPAGRGPLPADAAASSRALRDFANPFSILTKGTLILRDLALLRAGRRGDRRSASRFSVGFVDEQLWRTVEPGTPHPRRRLDAVRALTDAGFAVGVLMAPILPGLSDTDESIEATVSAIAAAGATSVTAAAPAPASRRPGVVRAWLAREHPHLVPRYRELYRAGVVRPAGVPAGVDRAGADRRPPARAAPRRAGRQPQPARAARHRRPSRSS